MCVNKVRYLTKKEAQSKLNFLKNSRSIKNKPKRIYYCEECKSWHLTHQIQHEVWQILENPTL